MNEQDAKKRIDELVKLLNYHSQLYSGNLRYSAGRILTFLSLLIPAFSLLSTPLLLIGTASLR